MRDHRVIRQEIVSPGQTLLFDVETGEFENLIITWSNSANSAAQPTAIVLCPTSERGAAPNSNLPNAPGAPSIGFAVYAALGGYLTYPLPEMLTVGVICQAGVSCSVKVEGDRISNIVRDIDNHGRNRS